jgi:hypothetical protein
MSCCTSCCFIFETFLGAVGTAVSKYFTYRCLIFAHFLIYRKNPLLCSPCPSVRLFVCLCLFVCPSVTPRFRRRENALCHSLRWVLSYIFSIIYLICHRVVLYAAFDVPPGHLSGSHHFVGMLCDV